MAQVSLVLGGCRSGKSRYALQAAELKLGERIFLATCPRLDSEMNSRIGRHEAERQARAWRTLEEPVALTQTLKQFEGTSEKVILIDCLSLWINNLIFYSYVKDEDEVRAETLKVVQAAATGISGTVYFVSSEVGLGLVPDTKLGRQFRDFLGACNQTVAAHADTVILLVAGIPIPIKPGVSL